jgi:hypothetical protein
MKFRSKATAAYREWAQNTVWFHRALFYALNIMVIAIGFAAIVEIPVEVLLIATKKAGQTPQNGRQFLSLTTSMKFAMCISLVLVAAISGGLAGLMRSLYRGGIYDNWWSLLGSFAAFAALVLYIGHVVRQITNALRSVDGDTSLIITFLTAWLLLLGYAAKVPWDEFRDRCAAYCEGKWDLRLYWDEQERRKATATATALASAAADQETQTKPPQAYPDTTENHASNVDHPGAQLALPIRGDSDPV